MKTVIIEYATVSPAVIGIMIGKELPTACYNWRDIDEDYFEFSVYGWEGNLNAFDLAKAEEVLARFV